MTVQVVTGYVPLDNPRSQEEYHAFGAQLLEATPARLFTCTPQECWLWPHVQGTTFATENYPHKNSLAYHCVQHQKTEWLCQAMRESDAKVFVWIDYGVFHCPGVTKAGVQQLVRRAVNETGASVPGIWPRAARPMHSPDWRFCGGVLVVHRSLVQKFHDEAKAATFERLRKYKYLTWEVNDWVDVEDKVPLRWYQASHDGTMLTNYCTDGTCLCMIVKNEAKIIERCLAAVKDRIDCWSIVDTGSTDGTQDKVKEMLSHLPGELHNAPFVNFEATRNLALSKCREMEKDFRYILLQDADMVLTPEPFPELKAPAYLLEQASGGTVYKNARLLRRDVNAQYYGVTHEYLGVDSPETLATPRFIDYNDGGSKDDKYPRDIRLLTAALRANNECARSAFYLANTYYNRAFLYLSKLGEEQRKKSPDAVRMQKLKDKALADFRASLRWYKRRAELPGWAEETWYAVYKTADCLRMLEDSGFVNACWIAYSMRPARAEPLLMLAKHYAGLGMHDAALAVNEQAMQIPVPVNDGLFVDGHAYKVSALETLAISGFYSQVKHRREQGKAACFALSTHESSHRPGFVNNSVHYVDTLGELTGGRCVDIRLDLDYSTTGDLGRLFDNHQSDKHRNGYASFYEALLAERRTEQLVVLEVGIGTMMPGAPSSMAGYMPESYEPGASLRAWRDWLPNAEVHGVDVAPDTQFEAERIHTHLCDSRDKAALGRLNLPEQFDLVVDDGLHDPDAQIATLLSLFPRVKPNGWYVTEDIVPGSSFPERARKLLQGVPCVTLPLSNAMAFSRAGKLPASAGWRTSTPSVAAVDGELRCILRAVNYDYLPDGDRFVPRDGTGVSRTRNFMLKLDSETLNVASSREMLDLTGAPRCPAPVLGFEDCRLFAVNGRMHASGTAYDLGIKFGVEYCKYDLDKEGNFVSVTANRTYEAGKTQKNWMPVVAGKQLAFVYLCDPTTVLDWTGAEPKLVQSKPAVGASLDQLRGSSQLVPWHDGWLCITHEVAQLGSRHYLHRFVWFGPDMQVHGVSDPFVFREKGVEFCCGLARWRGQLIASFSVKERESWLMAFPEGKLPPLRPLRRKA